MRQVPVSELKDALSRFLREAEKDNILITRNGKPAEVLIAFQSEDDWFDYRLENDPRFLQRIKRARKSLQAGRGVKIEDVREIPRRTHAARKRAGGDRLVAPRCPMSKSRSSTSESTTHPPPRLAQRR
jgi:prevent-host-death family protein